MHISSQFADMVLGSIIRSRVSANPGVKKRSLLRALFSGDGGNRTRVRGYLLPYIYKLSRSSGFRHYGAKSDRNILRLAVGARELLFHMDHGFPYGTWIFYRRSLS
jgi:hypothetical protein